MLRRKKTKRFPDFYQVELPTHLLDSLWIRNDNKALKIVFATGKIAEFTPIEIDGIPALHLT